MTSVRFFEGPLEREFVVHDTRMDAVPRVGETLTLRWPDRHEESRFKVLSVDYLLDVQKGISPVDELTGVRIQVEAI